MSMKNLAIGMIVMLTAAAVASAGSVSFDSPTSDASYVLLTNNGNAEIVDDPDESQTDQCLRIYQSSPAGTETYARIRSYAVSGTLAEASGSWDVYLPTSNELDLAPYMYFGVDTDGDTSTSESFVIQYEVGSGNPGKGHWFTDRLNDSTQVHVWGDRGDFGPVEVNKGEYSIYNTSKFADPDYGELGDLKTEYYDLDNGIRWGDLQVTQMTISIGVWPGLENDVQAYVDDITFEPTSAVPEPLTMLAVGSAVAGLGGYIRRRRRA
jgi:hypothetical protein